MIFFVCVQIGNNAYFNVESYKNQDHFHFSLMDAKPLNTLAHKHQFKILLKERCEIDYLHKLVLTSMWSEKLHHKSAKKSIKLW